MRATVTPPARARSTRSGRPGSPGRLCSRRTVPLWCIAVNPTRMTVSRRLPRSEVSQHGCEPFAPVLVLRQHPAVQLAPAVSRERVEVDAEHQPAGETLCPQQRPAAQGAFLALGLEEVVGGPGPDGLVHGPDGRVAVATGLRGPAAPVVPLPERNC